MREKYKSAADASDANPDEKLRRRAVERLADHLEIGVWLAGQCEILAAKPKGDRLAPIYAAARLMQANAAVAEALANVAQVERRRRSIVERIQPPDPKKVELNSHFQQEKVTAEQRLKIFRRLDEHIEQAMRARNGEEGVTDSVATLMQREEETLARLRGEEAGEDEDKDEDEDEDREYDVS